MEHKGKSCLKMCHGKEGKCKWCGPEGYCCQKGFKSKDEIDVDCNGGAFGGDRRHECVSKYKKKSYHSHCHSKDIKHSMTIKDEYLPYPIHEWLHSNQEERQNVFDKLQRHLKRLTKNALEHRSFDKFMKNLLWPHGTIHYVQFCSMWEFSTASYAPQFWLHHSFVDKIFSDWQAMPKREIPHLKERIMDPFGNTKQNPFSLTRKTMRQAWYYKTNLCYQYDDLVTRRNRQYPYQDPYLVADDCKKRSINLVVNGTNLDKRYKEEECSDKPKRIYKYKTYVGLVLPMHVESGLLQYSIDGSKDNLEINVISSHNVALLGGIPTETK